MCISTWAASPRMHSLPCSFTAGSTPPSPAPASISSTPPSPQSDIIKQKNGKFFLITALGLSAEGERLFCERHNCRIYPDNRGVYWHFKVGDYPAYTLPAEISRAYLNHEISIRDVYVHRRKNESRM